MFVYIVCHLRLLLLHEMVPIPILGTVDVPITVVSAFLSSFLIDCPRNMRVLTLFDGTRDSACAVKALGLSAAMRALELCTNENAAAPEQASRNKKIALFMLSL